MMNPILKSTIRNLKKASSERSQPIWAALADDLDKAKRKRHSINLSNINRHTEAGQIVAVPGKVLASGSLDHPVTVAAFAFSDGALKKITEAKGKAMTLQELMESEPKPSEIKIIK